MYSDVTATHLKEDVLFMLHVLEDEYLTVVVLMGARLDAGVLNQSKGR